MTPRHIVEGVLAGVAWLGQWILSEVVGEALVELVKLPFRRRKRRPRLTALERKAEDDRSRFWAEVVAEAQSRGADRQGVDSHILKLPRAPRLPLEAPVLRGPAARGGGGSPPPRRSTGG
jgi:hypothetical protein